MHVIWWEYWRLSKITFYLFRFTGISHHDQSCSCFLCDHTLDSDTRFSPRLDLNTHFLFFPGDVCLTCDVCCHGYVNCADKTDRCKFDWRSTFAHWWRSRWMYVFTFACMCSLYILILNYLLLWSNLCNQLREDDTGEQIIRTSWTSSDTFRKAIKSFFLGQPDNIQFVIITLRHGHLIRTVLRWRCVVVRSERIDVKDIIVASNFSYSCTLLATRHVVHPQIVFLTEIYESRDSQITKIELTKGTSLGKQEMIHTLTEHLVGITVDVLLVPVALTFCPEYLKTLDHNFLHDIRFEKCTWWHHHLHVCRFDQRLLIHHWS